MCLKGCYGSFGFALFCFGRALLWRYSQVSTRVSRTVTETIDNSKERVSILYTALSREPRVLINLCFFSIAVKSCYRGMLSITISALVVALYRQWLLVVVFFFVTVFKCFFVCFVLCPYADMKCMLLLSYYISHIAAQQTFLVVHVPPPPQRVFVGCSAVLKNKLWPWSERKLVGNWCVSYDRVYSILVDLHSF